MFSSLNRGHFNTARRSVAVLALVAISSLSMTAAQAATWPEKNLSVVVPFAAGGSTDMIGRMLAEGLSKLHPETSVVVENVAGGASIPSVTAVLRGGDNGNKILMASETPILINKYSFKNLPYNPDTGLSSVTLLYRTPHSLAVNANGKYNSFDELVTEIKKNPGTVTIGINVVGGSAHLSLDRWKKANNLDFELVPYKGGGVQAVTDLIGGHVDAHVDVLGNALPFAKDGKTKILAVLQNTKVAEFPDAVTQDENNPKDLTVASVLVLTVNGKTPAGTVDKIYESIKTVTQEKSFVEKMKNLYFDLVVSTPAEADKLRAEYSLRFHDMFESSGLPKK